MVDGNGGSYAIIVHNRIAVDAGPSHHPKDRRTGRNMMDDTETVGLIVAAVAMVLFLATIGVIVVHAVMHSRDRSSKQPGSS